MHALTAAGTEEHRPPESAGDCVTKAISSDSRGAELLLQEGNYRVYKSSSTAVSGLKKALPDCRCLGMEPETHKLMPSPIPSESSVFSSEERGD